MRNNIQCYIIIMPRSSQNFQNQEAYSQDNAKRNYMRIDYQLRNKLITKVQGEGMSIYSASRLLGIKNCTAKAILRLFRKKGHVFRRRSEGKERTEREPTTPISQGDSIHNQDEQHGQEYQPYFYQCMAPWPVALGEFPGCLFVLPQNLLTINLIPES